MWRFCELMTLATGSEDRCFRLETPRHSFLPREYNPPFGEQKPAILMTLKSPQSIALRTPTLCDASEIWQLVRDSGVLDCNSAYLYLLLCRDFSDTCLVATVESRVVGFVSAYLLPADSRTLFVWQIGVRSDWQGQGIGRRLLAGLVERVQVRSPVQFVEATVTARNTASRKLFQSFADKSHVRLQEVSERGFAAGLFPEGGHESEPLIRLGPFAQPSPCHDGKAVHDIRQFSDTQSNSQG
ncbi:MAG: diaminobutyrate acetyltransferase [Planctomycetaceae bacterium]